MNVGFVGLGAIGRPMALRLLAGGTPLQVYDVDPGRVAELAAAGAQVADDVTQLAARVDLLCVMVRDDAQVREVLGQVLAARRERPLTVAIHSTVAPHTPRELAETAPGVRLLDAPVSGGPTAATEGSLAILVGGAEEAYADAAPALRLMGSQTQHVGPLGAGTAMKLARNLVHFASFTAVTEAQRLAEASGLDLLALGEVVRHTDAITGGPGAIMHRATTATLAPDDVWHDVFAHVVALGEKDLGFAIDLADELGVDVPLARLARDRLAPGLGLPPEESR